MSATSGGQSAPIAVEGKAASDLAYIRRTMDRSSRFTAVSGWGGMGMAAVAFAAAPVAHARADSGEWLAVWMGAALAGFVLGAASIAFKARRSGQPLARGAGRRFALGLGPPIFVGGLLTFALHSAGATGLLPATWLLVFGAGLVTAGAWAVPAIPAMGLAFLAAGAAAVFAGPAWGDHFMAAGFGGIHLAGGVFVARKYGG